MDKKIFCAKCGKEITDLVVGEGVNLVDFVGETQPGGESLGYLCQECGDYMSVLLELL